MSKHDYEQLLMDGASGMYDRGLRDDWEIYYNAKPLKRQVGGLYERRQIFRLLDAETRDYELALDDFNLGY